MLHRALKPQMNHSDTDNSLPLPAITSITPNGVNLTHLATPRCPILQELDPRGATVPIAMPSCTQQTTVGLLPSDNPRTENSKNHSRLCLPMTPDCLTLFISAQWLCYILLRTGCVWVLSLGWSVGSSGFPLRHTHGNPGDRFLSI